MPWFEADLQHAGAVSLSEAAYELARSKDDVRPIFPYLKQEAWGDIWDAIRAGRLPAYVLDQEGRFFKVDSAQFASSQNDELRRAAETSPLDMVLRDTKGRHVSGELCLFWRDFETVFSSAALPEKCSLNVPAKKTRPAPPDKDLREFLNSGAS